MNSSWIDVEGVDYDNIEVPNRAPATALIPATQGQAATSVRRSLQAAPGNGSRAWQQLTQLYRPRNAMEASSSMELIIDQGRQKTLADLHRATEERALRINEHEDRFNEKIPDSL